MEREKIESVIESLLFVAGEPLSLKRICDIVSEAPRAEVRAALEELTRKYESEQSGLRITEVAGGYQLQTIPDNANWVGRLLQSRPVRLTRASIETLAIIAYRQPVTRPEIEEVRGVDSGGVLKTLLEHGFIRISGRKDVPGKPLIYATDKRFMEFFRLKSLAELPTIRELEEIQEERIAEAEAQGDLPLEEPDREMDKTEPAPQGEDDPFEEDTEDEPEPEEPEEDPDQKEDEV